MGMVDYWLDRIEDPFETFSMQEVIRSLRKLAEESEQSRFDRAGPWGTPSPKYYSVEDEQDIAIIEHLVGVAFVLGQATIMQARVPRQTNLSRCWSAKLDSFQEGRHYECGLSRPYRIWPRQNHHC